jgi:hypothetical protein
MKKYTLHRDWKPPLLEGERLSLSLLLDGLLEGCLLGGFSCCRAAVPLYLPLKGLIAAGVFKSEPPDACSLSTRLLGPDGDISGSGELLTRSGVSRNDDPGP